MSAQTAVLESSNQSKGLKTCLVNMAVDLENSWADQKPVPGPNMYVFQ